MVTIVEPGQNIIKLWGKQPPKSTNTYRLMRYVLTVEHQGKTALHNNISGQLVILNETEINILESLPAEYCTEMDELIAGHYLVPLDYDEHKQVVNLRKVLKTLIPNNSSITNYTILPTTACNARCYYCFEQGTKTITMTEKTADDTVKFITEHCGENKKVFITWFGGEPTVAAKRIDQICEGLQANNITYESMIYTNGYLFDEKMAEKAKSLWHLIHVQMSVDGTEQIYNKVKAYVNAKDSPYQRVMQNVGRMLEHKINVSVRMNVDYVNYQNFVDLMQDFDAHYKGNPLFQLSAYPLIGEYADHDGNVNHADESWISAKVEELNSIAKIAGFIPPFKSVPCLVLNACMSDNASSITIGADGSLSRCGEHFQIDDAIGSLTEGITNSELIAEWQKVVEPVECSDCSFFPNCMQLAKCSGAGHCYRQGKKQQYVWNIQYILECFLQKGGNQNEI